MRRKSAVLLALFASLLLCLAVAQSLPFRLGAATVPGTAVVLPEAVTVHGHSTESGVPSVVVFTMVEGCRFCDAVAEIGEAWIERYPGLQLILVDTRNSRSVVEAWAAEHGLDIVHDADDEFEEAFDTNRVPVVYLLDGKGIVRDKAVGPDHQRWITLDDQLARANQGDWEGVERHAAVPPVLGRVSAPLPSVPVGAERPVVFLVGDRYCDMCRELVASGLQAAINELIADHIGLEVFVFEPDAASLGAGGFYGIREVYQEYIARFGIEAAEEPIVRYARTGETLGEEMPPPVWPDDGWSEGVHVLRYQVGGLDDPAVTWGYNFKPGLLVFDGEGRYLGPTPFFSGNFGYDIFNVVNTLLPD